MGKYKYPRTYHFPFSKGISSDDKILKDVKCFDGKNVIVTIKMDGENTSIYKDYFHARSLDSKHEIYHSWLANYIYNFNYMLNNDMRVCGEYLYAKHSIKYDNLPSYFMGFSIWENSICLSWSDTVDWFNKLGIQTVPILYDGIFNETLIKKMFKETVNSGNEGIVVRISDAFNYNDFSTSVAKCVRKNHVQTDVHWKNQEIIKNEIL